MSVVIVAIPKKDDPVWKYSSEKVPHMTLLYLGDSVKDEMDIVQFVQHAADRSLTRFGLTVDRRGTLGSDEADVLFFEKDHPLIDDVKKFRSYLLGNKHIQLAYQSVDQYPEWTPHLTMGYPETPAKKDDRDYPSFHYVEFDRISVWLEQDDGPTFELKAHEYQDVMMSDKMENFLAHHGVKGMKWGVRKDDVVVGSTSQLFNKKAPVVVAQVPSEGSKLLSDKEASSVAKAIRRLQSDLTSKKTVGGVGQAVADVNEKYKGRDLQKDSVRRSYDHEVSKSLTKIAQSRAPEGSRALVVVDQNLFRLYLGTEEWFKQTYKGPIYHSFDGEILELRVVRDGSGFIMGFEDFDVLHTEKVNNFLAHHGVKGMRWGVRRTDAQLGNPDGGKNGVKSSSGVDVNKSKLAEGSRVSRLLGRKKKSEEEEEGSEGDVGGTSVKSRDPKGIDNPRDIVISEDAIRFVQTNLKQGHEMSTREIQDAIKRAEAVAKYNEIFNPDAATLAKREAQAAQAKVDALVAQNKYVEMTRTPGKLERARDLINGVAGAYENYSKLNDKLGGALPDPLAGFKKAAKDVGDVGDKARELTGGKSKKNDDDSTRSTTKTPGPITLSEGRRGARYSAEARQLDSSIGAWESRARTSERRVGIINGQLAKKNLSPTKRAKLEKEKSDAVRDASHSRYKKKQAEDRRRQVEVLGRAANERYKKALELGHSDVSEFISQFAEFVEVGHE